MRATIALLLLAGVHFTLGPCDKASDSKPDDKSSSSDKKKGDDDDSTSSKKKKKKSGDDDDNAASAKKKKGDDDDDDDNAASAKKKKGDDDDDDNAASAKKKKKGDDDDDDSTAGKKKKLAGDDDDSAGPIGKKPPKSDTSDAPFAGAYSSNWGTTTFTQTGDKVNGKYPGGTLNCTVVKEVNLACAWFESDGTGHAFLARNRTSGVISGSWGYNASSSDGGSWTFTPIGKK